MTRRAVVRFASVLSAAVAAASAARRRPPRAAGFSIVEAIVAIGIMTSAVLALAQLFAMGAAHVRRARSVSASAALAAQKIEQLRSLAWTFDAAGAPMSDLTSDTASINAAPGCPPAPLASGPGTGLSASPPDALDRDLDGWTDYVDAFGCALGGGTRPPPGTTYVRRWSVRPLASDPAHTLVVSVRVTVASAPGARGDADGATFVSVRTRTGIQ